MKNSTKLSVIARSKATKQSTAGFSQWIATLVSLARNDGKRAFTLAEVLITLTIIGVIAAITIPNLVQSYKKHQVEVGLKEAYSILSNAVKMSEAENGSAEEWNYSFDAQAPRNTTNFFETYILPYLKYDKLCKHTQHDMQKCGMINQSSNDWGYLDLSKNTLVAMPNAAILSNGMILSVVSVYSTTKTVIFSIDINGGKGKGIIGSDVFYFTLTPTERNASEIFAPWVLVPGGMYPYYSQPVYTYNSKNVSDFLGTSLYGGCNPNASVAGNDIVKGTLCAAAIYKNGWKIPDNYPIKKF